MSSEIEREEFDDADYGRFAEHLRTSLCRAPGASLAFRGRSFSHRAGQ
jgi:hypothetical protein